MQLKRLTLWSFFLICQSRISLVIEVDGVTHTYENSTEKDLERQKKLEKLGLFFLRFDDEDVKKNMSSVLRTIEGYIEDFEKKKSIPPTPFQGGVVRSNHYVEVTTS